MAKNERCKLLSGRFDQKLTVLHAVKVVFNTLGS